MMNRSLWILVTLGLLSSCSNLPAQQQDTPDSGTSDLPPDGGTGSTLDSDGDELTDADELTRGTGVNNPDTDGDGVKDGAEVLRYQTDPLSAASVPTLNATLSIAVAPATTCTVARFTASASNHPGPYTYSWTAGGIVSAAAMLETRFTSAGAKTVQVEIRNPDNVRGLASVPVNVAPASRDVQLVFRLRAADSDRLDFIRQVRLNAAGIGVPTPVQLFDDGFTGGDLIPSDGIFSNRLFVSSCENLSTAISANVTDATGATSQLALTPSDFIAP